MSEICILAIDPGLTGALAFYFPSAPDRVAVQDLPTAGNEIDTGALRRRIAQMGPTIAVVEQVAAMPKNGSIACFKLGMAYGAICAAVEASGVPLHRVLPQAWKKMHRLPGKNAGGDELARSLAIRLFPASAEHFERKKDHNRADAALIAAWAASSIASVQRAPSHFLSQAAVRSGCAGDGEGAMPSSPDLRLEAVS